jgi:integrase
MSPRNAGRSNPIRLSTCIEPKAPKARERVLNFKIDLRRADEVRRFWSASAMLSEPFGGLLRLFLLTGCRLNELAALRRDEVSDDFSTLSLPGTRTKNRRALDIYLPPLAQNLLASVKPPIEGCKLQVIRLRQRLAG